MTTQAQIAEALARKLHAGQFRRDGVTPYITHPEAVAAAVEGDEAKAVAWLHDCMEDCAATPDTLTAAGIHRSIVVAVWLVTRTPNISYDTYLSVLRSHPIARIVKIADIKHNLSCDPTDAQREKYAKALAILEAKP